MVMAWGNCEPRPFTRWSGALSSPQGNRVDARTMDITGPSSSRVVRRSVWRISQARGQREETTQAGKPCQAIGESEEVIE